MSVTWQAIGCCDVLVSESECVEGVGTYLSALPCVQSRFPHSLPLATDPRLLDPLPPLGPRQRLGSFADMHHLHRPDFGPLVSLRFGPRDRRGDGENVRLCVEEGEDAGLEDLGEGRRGRVQREEENRDERVSVAGTVEPSHPADSLDVREDFDVRGVRADELEGAGSVACGNVDDPAVDCIRTRQRANGDKERGTYTSSKSGPRGRRAP